MGYSVYENYNYPLLTAGYGVPAYCDVAGCMERIDRGMAYMCQEHVSYETVGDDEIEHVYEGCGLFFCSKHEGVLGHALETVDTSREHPDWIHHVLTDDSWARFRELHPEAIARVQ